MYHIYNKKSTEVGLFVESENIPQFPFFQT